MDNHESGDLVVLLRRLNVRLFDVTTCIRDIQRILYRECPHAALALETADLLVGIVGQTVATAEDMLSEQEE